MDIHRDLIKSNNSLAGMRILKNISQGFTNGEYLQIISKPSSIKKVKRGENMKIITFIKYSLQWKDCK